MRRNNWMAMVAMVAAASLVACAGDAGDTEDTIDDMDGVETTTGTPQATPQPPAGPAPEGATPEMVAQGQQIFNGKGNCFTCHGPQATGTPLAPDLTDDTWINIADGSWANIQQNVRTGVPAPKEHPSPMPPMGGAQLSDQEIQAVSAYVYSLSAG